MLIIDIRECERDIAEVASRLSMASAELQTRMVLQAIADVGFPVAMQSPQYPYPRELSNVVMGIQHHLQTQLYRVLRHIDAPVHDYQVKVVADGILQIEGF